MVFQQIVPIICSMVVHLFDRPSQLSTLRERVDSVVGGTIDRSMSGSEGFW